ncbi:MAG: FAD-dependent monooxygenase [Arsenophonus sp.]
MESFDLIIVGGGMVGLSLACGLKGCGMKIAIIENSPPQIKFNLKTSTRLRVSAINIASQKLLSYLGEWQTIIKKRVSICQKIKVWQKNGFFHIEFDAKEHYLSNLGYIIENSIIRESLWEKAQKSTDITLLTSNILKKVIWNKNEVFMIFNNNQILTTKLVVGADGAKSYIRKKADIPLIFWDYEHTALIATIRTNIPHMNTAYQAFNDDSILAFLPLYEPHICSIVWSLPTTKAHRCFNLEISAFEKELSVALDMRLGFCHLISNRKIFPLIGQYSRNFAGQRIVLLGDAAHTIHPLGGQGVNLGFMDVAELIGQLRYLHIYSKDIGEYFYLQNYERKRKHSAIMMLSSMQCLLQLFNGSNIIKKNIRDVGLMLTNILPCIKPKLINHALGLYDMPEWLKNA